ncbi:MAG: pyridoxal 5'-phosphate synthase glutaminase subunit PdxT [Actinobacteria bacterium]|nr:pyridoxal 5'-phosphate synthase glutaminase subunit PdxT [Actinomycetota bacterium]
MKVGVLALQGAYVSHMQAFTSLGVEVLEVRTPDDLEKIDRLVIPGGESTTISMLLDWNGMRTPIQESISAGMPIFGTCAGMIVLAREVLDGRDDQKPLEAIDITVRRNAFGRQVDSFESEIDVIGLDEPFPSVFIRAPIVESIGEGVKVYARVDEKIVLCGTDSILVASFHPELSNDGRIHEMFLSMEPSGSQR